MLHLQGSQKLQMLEKSLRMALPESLKVYGTIFHINQGNPFKLKALVDSWPDYNTVVIRPQEQEMTDDLDHYTNTYLIYSKDPKKSQELLGSPEVINWKQHLQIQSSQSSLNTVIENLVAINSSKVKHTQCDLFMILNTAKKLLPSLVDEKNLALKGDKPKSLRLTDGPHIRARHTGPAAGGPQATGPGSSAQQAGITEICLAQLSESGPAGGSHFTATEIPWNCPCSSGRHSRERSNLWSC